MDAILQAAPLIALLVACQVAVQASYVLSYGRCIGSLGFAAVAMWWLWRFRRQDYVTYFGPLLRDGEVDRLPGAFYFLV